MHASAAKNGKTLPLTTIDIVYFCKNESVKIGDDMFFTDRTNTLEALFRVRAAIFGKKLQVFEGRDGVMSLIKVLWTLSSL